MFSTAASILACAGYGVGGCVLLLKGRPTSQNYALAIAAFLTAIWSASVAGSLEGFIPSETPEIFHAVMAAGWLAVLVLFLRQTNAASSLRLTLCIIAGLLSAINFAAAFFDINFNLHIGIEAKHSTTEFALSVFALVLVENLFRNSTSQRMWSLKYLAMALGGLFGFEIVTRIPEILGRESLELFAQARPIIALIVLPLFAVTSVRNESLRLHIHSSRQFTFHTATILFAGVLLQGIAVAAFYIRKFGGTPIGVLVVVLCFTAVLGVIGIISSHTARSHLRTFINENFYNYKYDYRVEWERFIKTLSNGEIKTGPERALRTITDLLDSPGGTMWVRREGWRQFLPLAQWSLGGQFGPIDNDAAFLSAISDPECVFLDLSQASTDPGITTWQDRFPSAWLVVPIHFAKSVIGFALLQHPRAPRRLDWEDRRLIKLVTRDLGVHLVHEHIAQTLADTQQLAEFNKRVAFAVHDLKNTTGQLVLLLKNAERFGENPRFRSDMMTTIAHAARNLENLIHKLRQDQPAAQKNEMRDADLQHLMEGVLSRPGFRDVEVEALSQCSAKVLVSDSASLETAIIHVLANAVEASPQPGSVKIRCESLREDVSLVISDQGPGMTEEFIATQLFRPLRSTKGKGLGLGALQARTIMRDQGGDLLVSSVPGSGTQVTLRMRRTQSYGLPEQHSL